MVNSASVAGGTPPAPRHDWPRPQSPVWQVNRPPLLEQRVRAHTRPVHGAGTLNETDPPEGNSNPVVDSCGCPGPLVSVAGHMVIGQLFFTVIVAASAPGIRKIVNISN